MISDSTAYGTQGVPFSFFLVFSPGPITSYSYSPMPPGLSLNSSTGEISGTPSATTVSAGLASANNSCGNGYDGLTIIISGGS
jgi:hypothetical protein